MAEGEGEDRFSEATIRIIAERVNYLCSNPDCRVQTSGPHTDNDKRIIIGEAAHISAVSRGGKRFDPLMSPEKRRSPENGIWLCANCHTLIDKDEQKFPSSILRSWKEFAELRAEQERGMRTSRMNEGPQFQAKICSITGDNLNKYLKNAMSLEGFPNFNNWPLE